MASDRIAVSTPRQALHDNVPGLPTPVGRQAHAAVLLWHGTANNAQSLQTVTRHIAAHGCHGAADITGVGHARTLTSAPPEDA